jgi:hypothetical protein
VNKKRDSDTPPKPHQREEAMKFVLIVLIIRHVGIGAPDAGIFATATTAEFDDIEACRHAAERVGALVQPGTRAQVMTDCVPKATK